MNQNKQPDYPANTGLSNLRAITHNLLQLLDLEQTDEYGILRPSEYAYVTALQLILKVYNTLRDNFPAGSAGTDDTGSIRIIWQNRSASKKVSIFCSHSSVDTAYVYHQEGEFYDSEDLASIDVKILADRIASVSQV
jgi:hypothetical protein